MTVPPTATVLPGSVSLMVPPVSSVVVGLLKYTRTGTGWLTLAVALLVLKVTPLYRVGDTGWSTVRQFDVAPLLPNALVILISLRTFSVACAGTALL